MDTKSQVAAAALRMIGEGNTIGFGAGSNVAAVIELLSGQIAQGTKMQVVTSSFKTRLLCQQKGIPLTEIESVERLDLYFDGCDQFDAQLNALKSGGGIHTREKLLASMAETFVLLGDESKRVLHFTDQYPVVVDVLPEALPFVLTSLKSLGMGIRPEIRMSAQKDGAVLTDHGNVLVDLWLKAFPDPAELHHALKSITGVIETSLFIGLARKALIAGRGGVEVVQKND
jgi:ribose 5-phosphate isomerase A